MSEFRKCGRCPAEAAPGRRDCLFCYARQRAHRLVQQAIAKKSGKCIERGCTNKRRQGRVRCRECLAYQSAVTRAYMARKGEALREIARARRKRMRNSKILAGLCISDGCKRPHEPGRVRCRECLDKMCAIQKRHYRKHGRKCPFACNRPESSSYAK